MKKEHEVILRDITNDVGLLSIFGGNGGTGQWETGAGEIYVGVMGALGFSCSFPGGFYGPSNPTPTGAGTCVGGFISSSSAMANRGS
ncbi:hypothetical protein [Serratia rubidaea]|uniref:hypothetical protein n=1 Tax=Serratia rubidaea TaxID=61652 RepID=UPI000FE23DBB|nr:hypothetical protein [Serratia rubidaea]MCR0998028.1 hypothetical protein [Serratia rubidaea]QPR62916.1 hypothetical protein I6G83_19245 [Serratia rubidaea]HAY0636340.1 hypothetical protein [Serratia rubidaea]